MKKYKNGIFLLGLLCLLLIASGIFRWVHEKQSDTLETSVNHESGIQLEEENMIDVLVLGDSESYTSISPLQLWKEQGISAYIGGESGQRIDETYHILQTALETQKPQLLVLETNVLFRTKGSLEEAKTFLNECVGKYFSVIRYHNLWKQMFSTKEKATQTYKGFRIKNKVNPYKGKDYMKPNDQEVEISNYIRKYMDKIIQLCEENQITILLYSAPSPHNYNYQKHNALQAYADENHLAYLDFNVKLDHLNIDWNIDTLDRGDHLNISGAEKVTKFFGSYLRMNYALSDHKQDPKYQDWNEQAEAYDKRIQKMIQTIRS